LLLISCWMPYWIAAFRQTTIPKNHTTGTGFDYRIAGLAPAYCFRCGWSSGCIGFDWLLDALQGSWIQANSHTKEPNHRNRV
jgi:hypothetical protein